MPQQTFKDKAKAGNKRNALRRAEAKRVRLNDPTQRVLEGLQKNLDVQIAENRNRAAANNGESFIKSAKSPLGRIEYDDPNIRRRMHELSLAQRAIFGLSNQIKQAGPNQTVSVSPVVKMILDILNKP